MAAGSKKPIREYDNEQEVEKKKRSNSARTSGSVATYNSVRNSVNDMGRRYAKPAKYDRKLMEDPQKLRNYKKQQFESGKTLRDPLTGEKLVMTKKEAKALYGENWQDHLAEVDHIEPLKKIYEAAKGDAFFSTDDMRNVANRDSNYGLKNRTNNNAKRDKTEGEYANRCEKASETSKEKARQKGEEVKKEREEIQKNVSKGNRKAESKKAGREAAQNAAVSAATCSTVMNVVAVAKGEKEPKEALTDIAKDTGTAAVTGYVTGRGFATVTHALTYSKNDMLKALGNNNVPVKIVTAVQMTYKTFSAWGKGEITTEECILELGETGVTFVAGSVGFAVGSTIGKSIGAAVGQTLIPIPIVGGAIGSMIGSMLASALYNGLVNDLKTKKYEHEERLRIIDECRKAAELERKYRKELEEYLDTYFENMRECFENALSAMKVSFETGDTYGMIASSNEITRGLGGNVAFENVEEYKQSLFSDEEDYL